MADNHNLEVTPFAPRQIMQRRAAAEVWATLQHALIKVFKHETAKLSFAVLIRNVYNLVVDKHGAMVYAGVYAALTSHFTKQREILSKCSNVDFLPTMSSIWEDSLGVFKVVGDIFSYVDRTYVVQQRQKPIVARGLTAFFDTIVNYPSTRSRLQRLLQQNIELERRGEVIDRATMKTMRDMLLVLHPEKRIYQAIFERQFLDHTRKFYQDLASTYLGVGNAQTATQLGISCSKYLDWVSSVIQQEDDRANNYLDESTRSRLLECVDHELISRHAETLVHMEGSGVEHMFRHGQRRKLRQMYDLFSRVVSVGLQHSTDSQPPTASRATTSHSSPAPVKPGGRRAAANASDNSSTLRSGSAVRRATSSVAASEHPNLIFGSTELHLPLVYLRTMVFQCIKKQGLECTHGSGARHSERPESVGEDAAAHSSQSGTASASGTSEGGTTNRADAAESFVKRLLAFTAKCEELLAFGFRRDPLFAKVRRHSQLHAGKHRN